MFRGASSHISGQRAPVRVCLSDTVCETASTLRSFLSFATEGPGELDRNLQDVYPLAALLRKWDCTALRQTLRLSVIHQLSRSKIKQEAVFILAAHEDDEEMATLALRKPPVIWEADQPLTCGASGKDTLSPLHWPLSFWDSGIPGRYMFALHRAWGEYIQQSPRETLALSFSKYFKSANQTV